MAKDDFIKVGMIGRVAGVPWDEKGRTNLVQIFIWHGEEGISAIQCQYVENGSLVLSECHGIVHGNFFDIVKLNYPSEHITWISGQATEICDNVFSLKIGSNYREYGPFGGNKGDTNNNQLWGIKESNFCFHVSDQFGGFFGAATSRGLASIGVYLKPITTLEPGNQNANRKPVKLEG